MKNVIILGGAGGSGRSTLAKQLATITGMRLAYGGLRKLARELGFGMYDEHTGKSILTEERLIDFQNNYVPHHPEIDLRLDADLFEEASMGDVIIESVTLAPLTKRLELPYTRIWVAADENTRIGRIIERERKKGETVDTTTMRNMLTNRNEENRTRYQSLYGFNFDDQNAFYEIVFDTTNIPEDQMGQELLEILIQNQCIKV